ncbi:TniQ family protein [Pseudotabrizicola algicola]|uniref:TniQ family protein n=1 Tax=Pseudotabrizicola algicola TaxID=2709381 RepID=A0A6B3RR75_9RHOB|nr:TniQ family protein [Pseudotabrizicola algicola]NEX48674.1 TniQ family protein [Pseudotabrizicola algicola]
MKTTDLLPVKMPRPAHRETVFSFLSRCAATWQTTTRQFAYDIGTSLKFIAMQNEVTLRLFAERTKLSPEDLAELMSWTGEKIGNVRMRFREEVFVSRALRNPDVQGCPMCLREDIAAADTSPTAVMVMRGNWLMRDAVLCIRHGHPLVTLWSAVKVDARYDIGANLEAIMLDLQAGAFDRPRQEPSPYDLWLDRRLEDGTDSTALKDHGLFAATTFCRYLGMARLGVDIGPDKERAGAFLAAGFEIAAQGASAIRSEFDRLAARATEPKQGAKTAFGELYSALGQLYTDDPGFTAFRIILRDCILDHWPYAPGELLLGEPVLVRRKHSVSSAAEEIGIGQKLVRQFLIEAGAVQQYDPRPDARLIFDAEQNKALLAEIPTLVGPIAMQDAMGATKMELIALEEEGLLAPRTRIPSVKNVWRIADGEALVAKLLARAARVAADDPSWETLLLARKRTGIGLAKMVHAIDAGSLDVGARQGVAGFHGIVVRLEQLAPLIAAKEAPDPTEGGKLQSAAAFGRSIGLRDNRSFAALMDAGHVPAKARLHPGTKRMQYWMDEADIAAFTARFATPSMLIAETGLHRNTI